jgi:hypothetical protein
MITFYASKGCKECDQIEEMISDLSLAHRTLFIEEGGQPPGDLANDVSLPAMEDEHEIFSGHGQIMEHINDLSKYSKRWYKYQSDVCYVEDDSQE